jgi:sterol desaturase/sphingolipid hydroxylase (fatty acid hydroxylase superfamily)
MHGGHGRPRLRSSLVTEAELQVLRSAGFVIAALLAVLAQRLSPHGGMRGSWRVNGGLWLVDVAVVGAVCGACGFTAAAWAARNGFGVLNLAGASPWAAILATIVALDLVSYGWHWANHRIRFLWRLHQVHHSDPAFTVSTGVRFHPGELLLSLPVRLAAVVLVGAPVAGVLVFEVAFALANLIEHGDIGLPIRAERRLAWVWVTPALHRRHHTKIGPERDTNFGTVFSTWDRSFGTFTPSDSATRVETGLPGMDEVRLGGVLRLPFRSVAR